MLAGWKAWEAKQFGVAREHFERAVELAPERADVHLGLGEALFWLGQHQAALACFERAAHLAPKSAHAHSGIGHAHLHLAGHAWQQPRTHRALLARAEAAIARAQALDKKFVPARDGQRILALVQRPVGKPLHMLEWIVAGLLLGLCITGGLRLRRSGMPRIREYLWPLGLFAGTRVLLFAAFAAAPALLTTVPGHPYAVLHNPDSVVLDAVAGRWDSNLYADVAVNGYRLHPNTPDGAWGTVGQFPLLPVLFRWLAIALDDGHLAALILPNAALLLACLFLFGLVRTQYGPRLATGAVCVMLVHPSSLHGSVLYAESLALLGMTGAAFNFQRGALASAGLWGVFAGLARINTLAIVPWLLFDAWHAPGGRSLRSLLARVSPAIGVSLFMLYLQVEFGDALAYFHELRDRRFGGNASFVGLTDIWGLLAHLAGKATGVVVGGPLALLLFALACLAIYTAALVALIRERAFGPALFVASGIVLTLGSNLPSHPRYLWLLFPAAVCIARAADRPVLRYALPLASLALLLVGAAAYARWYFVP